MYLIILVHGALYLVLCWCFSALGVFHVMRYINVRYLLTFYLLVLLEKKTVEKML